MAALDKLLQLLDEAVAVASGYCTPPGALDGGAELADELQRLRQRVAQQDGSALDALTGIFAPTGAWDDSIGAAGAHLADQIMAALDELQQACRW